MPKNRRSSEWYSEAQKYGGKNSAPNIGSGVDRLGGVPVTRPFVVPPGNNGFRDRWEPRPRGKK